MSAPQVPAATPDEDDEEDPFTLPDWILAAGSTSEAPNNGNRNANFTDPTPSGLGMGLGAAASAPNSDGFPSLSELNPALGLGVPPPCTEARPLSGEEVRVQVRQRRTSEKGALQVLRSAQGDEEIPLAVRSTTHATAMPREVLERSPWLTTCLQTAGSAPPLPTVGGGEEDEWGESSTVLWRSFNPKGGAPALDDDAFEEDLLGPSTSSKKKQPATSTDEPNGAQQVSFQLRGETSNYASLASKVLDVGLPSSGIGKLMLPNGLYQCLELAGPTAAASVFDAKSSPVTLLISHLLWSLILDLEALASACREALANTMDLSSVALVLALAAAANDDLLLRACYWCLKDAFCSAAGAPPSWFRGAGSVKLLRGALSYADICSTPLSVLSKIPEQDHLEKFRKWRTPFEGYTLCQVHRKRGEDGAYPHVYELVLDHSEEVVMRAVREDEQSCCRIFSKDADPLTASEHSKEYLGNVVPNFWGTIFTVFDSGTDVDALGRRSREALELPLRRQAEACVIGYDTNLMGDTPRHIYLDFQSQDGKKHHMENMQPRWDKRLNSYALPFFGRVKKASAKNFQLVVNSDPNTIYLIFGKISKDVFCLDYRAPIAHLEAFGIGLAALAKKRAVS